MSYDSMVEQIKSVPQNILKKLKITYNIFYTDILLPQQQKIKIYQNILVP